MIDTRMLCQMVLILVFVLIFVQDYKERLVYWFYYPLVGLLAAVIQYFHTGFWVLGMNVSFNLLFVLTILLCAYGYCRFKLRIKKLTDAIGLGDILLFLFLTATFSIAPFVTVFVFSLIFALVLHLALKTRQAETNVPLAGYMSLFFGMVYAYDMLFMVETLYAF